MGDGQMRILRNVLRKTGIQPVLHTVDLPQHSINKRDPSARFSHPVNIENKKRAEERKKAREKAKLNQNSTLCGIPAFIPNEKEKKVQKKKAAHKSPHSKRKNKNRKKVAEKMEICEEANHE